MKKIITAILFLALAASAGAALVACNDENKPTPPPSKPTISEEELLKGVWETPQYGDATHALKDYVAFHDDGVFYWRAQGDKNPSAGNYTFTLENGDVTVTIDDTQKGEYDIDVEAWVTLKTFKGEAVAPTGDTFQDGKYPIAYDTTENQYVLYGIHYGDMRFIHDPDRAHTYADEDSITVASYTGESATRKVELGHNGRYTDMATGTFYEGKWTYNASTKTYTLTDDEGGGTATIVDSANGAFGAYKRGSTEITLDNADFRAETLLSFKGAVAAAGGAEFTLNLYNNNKFDLILDASGDAQDTGTWELTDGQYVVTGAKVTATTAGESGARTITIMGSVFNEVVPASALLELNGTFVMNAANNINGSVSAVLYDNNTAVITTKCVGNPMVPDVVENGTYSAADGKIKITIPVDGGDDKVYEIAETNGALSFTYAVTMSMGENSVPFSGITVSFEDDVAMTMAGDLVVNPQSGTTATTKVIMYGSLASGGGKVVIVTNLGGVDNESNPYILSSVAEIGSWTLNPDYTMTLTVGDNTFTNEQKPNADRGIYTFDYTVTLRLGENSMPATISVTTVPAAAQE